MGEDWGDAASRLAALREVRTKMLMVIVAAMMVVIMVIVVMLVTLVIMEMVIVAVDCGSSQGVEDGIPSGF